jgi:FkbM family methyltransferase
MKETLFKAVVRACLFPPGAVRRIYVGPLRGMRFRVSPITGLAPSYSGTERAHQKVFRCLVKPGDVVVDVGANWGQHTLYMSRLVGALGSVIALEPYPPAFVELQWHLAANSCRNVLALLVALSDQDGWASFQVGAHASVGSLVAAPERQTGSSAQISVTTRSLDTVVQLLKLSRLNLIKIDVEGAEALVLAGASEAITRFQPALVIDLHTPEQDLAVARWLTQRGYRLQRLVGPSILRTDRGWPHSEGVWGSLLALPAG